MSESSPGTPTSLVPGALLGRRDVVGEPDHRRRAEWRPPEFSNGAGALPAELEASQRQDADRCASYGSHEQRHSLVNQFD